MAKVCSEFEHEHFALMLTRTLEKTKQGSKDPDTREVNARASRGVMSPYSPQHARGVARIIKLKSDVCALDVL